MLADGRVVRLGEGADAPQLIPLLCGSEGTLAVVTEVLLRLIPAPAARATLAGTFDGMDARVGGGGGDHRGRHRARGARVPRPRRARRHRRHGGGRRRARAPGRCSSSRWRARASEVNAARRGGARRAGRSAGARTLDHATSADEAARLWRLRKSVSAAVAKVQIGKVNEDVVVPRDRVAELVARSRQIGLDNGSRVVNFGHLGDGNIHTTFLIDPRVPG